MADSFNHLPSIAAALPNVVAQIVAKAARDVEAHALMLAPVDTGALRASISAEQESTYAWLVSVGVDYAAYQEYGTVHMPPHPYMRPAADTVRPSFEAAMRALEGRLPQR